MHVGASSIHSFIALQNPLHSIPIPQSIIIPIHTTSHHFFRLLSRFIFHSALATLMNKSSSRIGIQLVNTFIAFSKSLARRISLIPSIRAAEVAWRTSRVEPNGGSSVGAGGWVVWSVEDMGVEVDVGERKASLSPRRMKTSQTRSWAGKGIE